MSQCSGIIDIAAEFSAMPAADKDTALVSYRTAGGALNDRSWRLIVGADIVDGIKGVETGREMERGYLLFV